MNNCFVYLLISQDKQKTYVGFTDDLESRIKKHKNKGVKTTKDFGNFNWVILEKVLADKKSARAVEKYWKSTAGRKKIKEILNRKN